MSRRAALIARVTLVCGVALLLTLVMAAAAFAGTPASCSSDTATSYCEAVQAGTNATTFMTGFGLAEAAFGAVLLVSVLLWALKRSLEAAGG